MKNRNYGVDFLKFICAFLVICIHAPFPHPIGTVVTPIARIAVPVFFMITGYYYTFTLQKQRCRIQLFKILKLFIGANIIYLVYELLKLLSACGSLAEYTNNLLDLKVFLKFALLNQSPFSDHLWYLGAILYVLLIIYLFEKKWDRKKLYPVIPFLLLTDIILGKYSLLIFGRTFPYILVRNFLFVGLPYFLLGDMLFRIKPKFKSHTLLFFSFLFSFTTLIERLLLGLFSLNTERDHYISTTFLAITVFLFALQHENESNNKYFKQLSYAGHKMSLAIYILHPVVIEILYKFFVLLGEKEKLFLIIYNYTAPIFVLLLTVIIVRGVDILNKKLEFHFFFSHGK